MDPLELRLKNANQPGKTKAVGADLKLIDMTECLERATAAAGWKEKRKTYGKGEPGKPWRGIGVATMIHTAGGNRFYGYNSASSVVKVAEDGLVTLVTPACDMGQGALTVVAQICAEEMGVSLDDLVVITDDTDLTPYDLGSWGSRTTWVVGQAAQAAARDAKKQILDIVAGQLEASPEDLESREGRIGVRGAPDRGMSFAAAVDVCFKKRGTPIQAEGKYVDEVAPESMDWDTQSPNFASAAHVVEVEVDPDTGKVRVLDFQAAHAIGLAINPMAAEGQIEGSVAQGVGFGLMEELILDGGKTINPNFADYKIPSFLDIPKMEAILVENPDPDGPFGAVGIGEPGLVPTAAAVANAIAHATGCHFRTLPVTAEKILKALKDKKG
jgi:xanthine dehydrogenase molybdenum-binding subunit